MAQRQFLTSIRLIGMAHLLPLPGAPGYGGSRQFIYDRALADARILQQAGFDAILVENFGDAPYAKTEAGKHVIAEMSAVITALQNEINIPVGVQVLRNDAEAALAVAAATGARFIRINVHSGAMVTDQGVIEGRASDTLRYRQMIDARGISILADVFVKHGTPLAPSSLSNAVRDTVERSLADGVIISGSGTGEAADLEDVQIAAASTATPVFVGSGVRPETLAETLSLAHGIIVGTAIKVGRITVAPVDPVAATEFADRAHQLL
ncbi:MAG: BtpA/SgcQ family protein [Bacteroidetes bacterium]|nr:BtpA/SgcQ family protein [Bacteroidota bacterium]